MSDKIQLFLEWPGQGGDGLDETAWMEGVDGLVVDPRQCDPMLLERTGIESAILRNGDPKRDASWLERPTWWAQDGELEQIARRRDDFPELSWIPHMMFSRAQVSYRFSGQAIGEGFSFYTPDTSAVKGWRIHGTEFYLHEVVTRAKELGFTALWLHSPDAEVRGDGLELDLLDKVRAGPLDIWLSGGAAEERHLSNLAKAGGAAAVVVNEGLARGSSAKSLCDAMALDETVPEAVPIHFERQSTQAG